MKLFFALLFATLLALSGNAQSCLTTSLIINTGYDPITGAAITPGDNGATAVTDPHWTVSAVSADVAVAISETPITGLVEVSPGGSADVVVRESSWASNPAADPGGWISCLNSNTYYDDGTGRTFNMTLSRSFTMCTDDSITLTFNYADDNYASTANIDGTFLFSQPVGDLTSTYSTYASFTKTFYLSAGTHTINIEVNDYVVSGGGENPTGLDLYGTVSSATGTASLVSESSTACLSYVCGTLPPCNVVTLPDTLSVCTGTTDTLPGSISGSDSVLSIYWTPSTGLSNDSIIDPSFIATTSGWYTVIVESLLPDNLIDNGSFSIGNVDFSTGYSYITGGSSSPGEYGVGANPYTYNPAWPVMGDHTTGTGKMLIVDGSASSSTSFWCQSIAVTPGTTYIFSVWSALLHLPEPSVQVSINGVGIGTFATSATTADWTQYTVSWNSGTATTADICLYDLSTTGDGNDFAIDDISFDPTCVDTDSIYVSVINADTSYTHTDTAVCASSVGTRLTAPSGYVTFLWSTGATTDTINVTTSGSYWVSEIGPCIARVDTFNVTVNPIPVVDLGDDTTFCSGSSVTLRSADIYTSPAYLWSTGSLAPSINVTTAGTYWLDVTVAGCTGSDTVLVNLVPTPPTPTFPYTPPVCSGNLLLLTTSLGSYTYAATFNWAGPNGFTSTAQDTTITNVTTAATGFYSVTATFEGCVSAVATEAVLIDSTPAAPVINLPVTICQYGTIDLTASSATAGAMYTWTSTSGFTSTLQNPVIDSADTSAHGIYTVTISTDANSCTSFSVVAVTVNAIPTLLFDSTWTVCSGQNLQLESTFTYPDFETFSWTGPLGFTSALSDATVVAAPTTASGIYSVTAARYGCTSPVYTISATVDSTPAPPYISSNSPVCQGDTLKFTAADSTSGVTYNWSGPDLPASALQDPFITDVPLTAAGTYKLIVTLGTCVDSASTTVSITPVPAFTPSSNSPVCSGDTLLLYANGLPTSTFTWTGPYPYAFATYTYAPDPIIAGVTTENSGVYTVTALYNGCTIAETDTVVINQTPVPPAVSWLTYCQYYPAPPLMADDTGLNWYSGDTISAADHLTATPVPSTAVLGNTYFYLTQTINGCQSAIDSIQITVNPVPTVTATPVDTSVCPHSTFMLTATGSDVLDNYHWSPGIYLSDTNTASVMVSPETDVVYTVVATNQYGCADTATSTISVYPSAIITLGADSVTLYPGESYSITASTNCTSFSWFPPAGLSSTTIANPVASPAVNTNYIVYGQTDNGCTTADSISIYVTANSLLALPNAFTPGNGPNSAFKIIKRGEATLNYFRIFNRWGQKVFETTNIDAGWDGTFNGTPQPFDVYVYEIEAVTTNGQNFLVQGNLTLIR